MNTITNILASAAAVGLVSLAPVASAQTRVEPVEVEALPSAFVSYADLDLDGDAGMKALDGRLRAAAYKVCGQRSRLLKVDAQRKACFDTAMAGAQEQIAAARTAAVAKGPRLIVLSAARGSK